MQQGQIKFTRMEKVIFGEPAAEAVKSEAERRGATGGRYFEQLRLDDNGLCLPAGDR